MEQLIRTIISGLGQGSVYALVALGFVIIYKSTLVISFAQPALMITGGLAVVLLQPALGFWWALVAGIAIAAVVAALAERLALRPMIGEPVFVVAIITIGIDIALRVVQNRIIGTNVRFVQTPWGLNSMEVGGIAFAQRDVIKLAAMAVVVIGLFSFFKYSRFGLGMRAAAFDQETALAQGIDVGRVFSVSWALAGAMAAIAGVFVGGEFGLNQQAWIIALKALPAIIIGGLDSVGGAVIGGLAVGVVEQLVANYQTTVWNVFGLEFSFAFLGSNFAPVSPYLLLLIVLLIKPYGLFGTPEVERV
jgi:branched-chain amino acid transport system permease protein